MQIHLPAHCSSGPTQQGMHKTYMINSGGNCIEYTGEVKTKTAQLTMAKLLLNSIISTKGAQFLVVDIKNFYLNTPMEWYEYMAIPMADIPQTIIDQYKLNDIAINGMVYVKIWKGMYGLPQARYIANDQLIPILKAAGYHQAKNTPGLFKHLWQPITFSLVVDDFGIKYVSKEHADHLIHTLEKKYTISQDWTGATYLGLTLKWDYENNTVDLSMPGYIEKALQCFQHIAPMWLQHVTHP